MRRRRRKEKKRGRWGELILIPLVGGLISTLSRKGTEVMLPMLTKGR